MTRLWRVILMTVLGVIAAMAVLSAGSCGNRGDFNDRYEFTPSGPPATRGWTHYTSMPSGSMPG